MDEPSRYVPQFFELCFQRVPSPDNNRTTTNHYARLGGTQLLMDFQYGRKRYDQGRGKLVCCFPRILRAVHRNCSSISFLCNYTSTKAVISLRKGSTNNCKQGQKSEDTLICIIDHVSPSDAWLLRIHSQKVLVLFFLVHSTGPFYSSSSACVLGDEPKPISFRSNSAGPLLDCRLQVDNSSNAVKNQEKVQDWVH